MSPKPKITPLPAAERYSVTLVPPAVAAVNKLTQSTGLSKTDVINRAVQLYAFVDEQLQNGSIVLIRHPDGETERVVLV
ncbi:hypothetical protein SRB5_15850 [Streptomyces sp. RB5]|uniref:Ribbon-helix-helix protein CopG domain-containing protein n=2 Tax=Streptomyces smaragdinus TaxID=2585196 RepID=A0A7K0CDB1_9ACTN|nr:hypothetical protein [Streptomyces smaragdinus]